MYLISDHETGSRGCSTRKVRVVGGPLSIPGNPEPGAGRRQSQSGFTVLSFLRTPCDDRYTLRRASHPLTAHPTS